MRIYVTPASSPQQAHSRHTVDMNKEISDQQGGWQSWAVARKVESTGRPPTWHPHTNWEPWHLQGFPQDSRLLRGLHVGPGQEWPLVWCLQRRLYSVQILKMFLSHFKYGNCVPNRRKFCEKLCFAFQISKNSLHCESKQIRVEGLQIIT